jgi:hypothetical protein
MVVGRTTVNMNHSTAKHSVEEIARTMAERFSGANPMAQDCLPDILEDSQIGALLDHLRWVTEVHVFVGSLVSTLVRLVWDITRLRI